MLNWLFGDKQEPIEDIKSLILNDAAEATPDRLLLERSEHVLLFEYGELMTGMPKNSTQNMYWVSKAFSDEKFGLCHNSEDYPDTSAVAFRKVYEQRFPKAVVQGELFMIKSCDIEKVDNYRQNGVNFVREEVRVVLPFLRKDGLRAYANAWMYVGDTDYWHNRIDFDICFYRGREGSRFRPCKKLYYDRPGLSNVHLFTKDAFKKREEQKCFLHLKNGHQHVDRESSTMP